MLRNTTGARVFHVRPVIIPGCLCPLPFVLTLIGAYSRCLVPTNCCSASCCWKDDAASVPRSQATPGKKARKKCRKNEKKKGRIAGRGKKRRFLQGESRLFEIGSSGRTRHVFQLGLIAGARFSDRGASLASLWSLETGVHYYSKQMLVVIAAAFPKNTCLSWTD